MWPLGKGFGMDVRGENLGSRARNATETPESHSKGLRTEDFLGPLTYRSGTLVPGDVVIAGFYGLMTLVMKIDEEAHSERVTYMENPLRIHQKSIDNPKIPEAPKDFSMASHRNTHEVQVSSPPRIALLLCISAPFVARQRATMTLLAIFLTGHLVLRLHIWARMALLGRYTRAFPCHRGWFLAFSVFPYSQDRPKRIFQQHVLRSEANWSLSTQEAWPSSLPSSVTIKKGGHQWLSDAFSMDF